jgi:hypothetical protein
VFFFAALIGVGIYFSLHAVSIAYIDTVYTSEENKKEREQNYLEDLKSFINENEISLSDTSKISEWVRENKYVYLLISKEGEIFFTSDDAVDEGDEGQTTPDSEGAGSDGDQSDEKNDDIGGGITVTYPSREELLEYAKVNDMHPIELSDGLAAASFVEFTEYLYYDASVSSGIPYWEYEGKFDTQMKVSYVALAIHKLNAEKNTLGIYMNMHEFQIFTPQKYTAEPTVTEETPNLPVVSAPVRDPLTVQDFIPTTPLGWTAVSAVLATACSVGCVMWTRRKEKTS